MGLAYPWTCRGYSNVSNRPHSKVGQKLTQGQTEVPYSGSLRVSSQMQRSNVELNTVCTIDQVRSGTTLRAWKSRNAFEASIKLPLARARRMSAWGRRGCALECFIAGRQRTDTQKEVCILRAQCSRFCCNVAQFSRDRRCGWPRWWASSSRCRPSKARSLSATPRFSGCIISRPRRHIKCMNSMYDKSCLSRKGLLRDHPVTETIGGRS